MRPVPCWSRWRTYPAAIGIVAGMVAVVVGMGWIVDRWPMVGWISAGVLLVACLMGAIVRLAESLR